MREYKAGLIKDIERANKELAELQKQLQKATWAISPCQNVETVKNVDEGDVRESIYRWIGHAALIRNFRTNCDTLMSSISWVLSDLEVLEHIVRKETKEDKQC